MKRKIWSMGIVGLLLFSSLFITTNFVSDRAKASDWVIEIVDSVSSVGEYNSIATDNNDYAHISYYDFANSDLKYARWTGSEWIIELVDSTGDVGMFTSIAIDSYGYSHISYYDRTNGALKYAKWSGSSWDIKTVDSVGDVGLETSLDLDSNGHAHISYYDYTNFDIKYAKWTGSGWSIETIDSISDFLIICSSSGSSIALDSNDYAHISYHDNVNFSLKHAKWTGSDWNIDIVDSIGDCGWRGTSISIDSNDYPHISYGDWKKFDLKYAKWTGSGWNIQTVDSEGMVGGSVSMTLDANDYPHMSYYYWDHYTLKYARWTGSGWNLEFVEDGYVYGIYYVESEIGFYNSMNLDSHGNAHISYNREYSNDLKYSKKISLSEPSVPRNLTGNAGNGQVTLNWNPPASDGGFPVTNYNIYRGTTSGGETLLTTIGNITTYTDIEPANNQTYYYQVSAINVIGESVRSNEVSVSLKDAIGKDTGLPTTLPFWIWLLIGIIIASIIIVSLFLVRRRKKSNNSG